MDTNQIMNEVNEIFVDVLDNESIKLTAATSAKDIEDWDSLSHIQLVVAMEKHFKKKFTTAEIQGWKNVGEMVNTIEQKMRN